MPKRSKMKPRASAGYGSGMLRTSGPMTSKSKRKKTGKRKGRY